MEIIFAALQHLDWAKTLQGFFILVSFGALGWVGGKGVQHIFEVKAHEREVAFERIRAMDARLRQGMFDVQIALAECQADGVSDRGFVLSWRALCAEYRTALLQATGGKRQMPPEVADMEEKYQELRRAVHDENNRRIARLKEKVADLERTAKDEREDDTTDRKFFERTQEIKLK